MSNASLTVGRSRRAALPALPSHVWGILAVLAVGGWALWRLYHAWQVMPPGDTFNFLYIARFLMDGTYPENEKRLPLYGILLIPQLFLPVDPLLWGKAIASLAGLAAAGFLYRLLAELGLPPWSGVLAAALALLDPIFLWSSTRALSDVPYAALTLASAWLVLRAARRREARIGALAGVSAGLAGLTRPEGMIVLAITGAVLLWQLARHRSKAWLWGLVAMVVLMAPWAAFNAKRYGAPWGSPYLVEARGEDYGASGPRAILGNVPRVFDLVVLGEKVHVADPASEVRGRIARPSELARYVRAQPFETASLARVWLHGLLFVAGAAALAIVSRPGLLVLGSLFLGHLLVVAWWSPTSRFALILYPLVAALVGAGAFLAPVAAERWGRPGRLLQSVAVALGVVLVVLASARAYRHTQGQLAQDNYRGYTLYAAVLKLAGTEGRVLIPSDSYLMARLYLGRVVHEPPYRGVFLNLNQISMVEEELQALRAEAVRYVLRHSEHPDLPRVLDDDRAVRYFRLVERFTNPNPNFADEWTEIWEFLDQAETQGT